ncbi:MAG: 2-hydroxyacid dehydrogenase [Devosiaceae bacterium]|nr:2-hydroxyacid dehydrogenase [Devosiaceae bacterium]
MSHPLLITNTMVKVCEPELEAIYQVERLYDQSDPLGFLSQNGHKFSAIAGADVTGQMMALLPNLKMISSFGVGYDSIDIGAAKSRGISVTNTPDVLNDAMGEITIGLMIALSRQLVQAHNFVCQGEWQNRIFPLQSELRGKTVGIIGLGRIGKEIAARCQAMKMRVVYFGRTHQKDQPYVYYDDLEHMARDVDWLVAITPGGAGTDNLITAEVLAALGPNGYFVNMARGSLVDQPALIAALEGGQLAGAALDVFADEPNVPDVLTRMDNVVLSPHQGSATVQTRAAMGALVVANLKAFFAGEPLLTQVV